MISKIITIIVSISAVASNLKDIPEDGRLNFTGLAMKYIGRVEEYDVTTEDGYILKLHRVPGDTTRPVHIMHGLMGSSSEFIMQGKDSLVYALANAGYDVWLGNYRGNRYSRRHVSLNPDGESKSLFWQFGPHEHGCSDLATFIDFILSKTEQRQLSLIGHSEGTMITYILASERPEYNEKIKIFIALAPVLHVHYVSRRLPPQLLQIAFTLIKVAKRLKIEELGEYDGIRGSLLRKYCGHDLVGRQVCRQVLLSILGFNAEGLQTEFMSTLLWHYPAGSSRMNLEHELQLVATKRFANFDYGPAMNLQKYGSRSPPLYDIKRVTMKVFLFAAKNDRLAVLEDTSRQARELPRVVGHVLLDDELFNHADFVWTRRCREIQPRVLEVLHDYN